PSFLPVPYTTLFRSWGIATTGSGRIGSLSRPRLDLPPCTCAASVVHSASTPPTGVRIPPAHPLGGMPGDRRPGAGAAGGRPGQRSEEHTSELQSRFD